ncbi:MAG: copper resistance protein CopD [Caulobacterales bacterium 32-69-10]|nr:MAG: copper resistance protein CopD [Caulobacterales bacterium 32-69-10]
MLEPAVVVLRLIQYAAVAILMGSPLFFVYALPAAGPGSAAQAPWARGLLAAAGALLAVSALMGLVAQTGIMAGSLSEGLKPESLIAVVTGMGLGMAGVARAACGALAVVLVLSLPPGRAAWLAVAALGAIAAASFAWMGHGAATEGAGHYLHLVADILHAWAAAIWVGALWVFLLLARAGAPGPGAVAALHRALQRFSGVGTILVAILVLTGLINSGFLVGPDRIEALWTTPYGRLLSLKLAVFAGMLGLAAANRFRLTPALGLALEAPGAALAALRRSLMFETALGLGVLALVAWFGTLAPPAAG